MIPSICIQRANILCDLVHYKLTAAKIKPDHLSAQNHTERTSNREASPYRTRGKMEMKTITEEKSSPRRRFSRSGRNQKPVASSILEAISQISGGEMAAAAGEVGRMKIVVKKEDLKQVLEAIRDNGRGWGRPPALSLEQRLNLMRRRQILRAANRSRRSWKPVLQSIPEEI